MMQLDTERFEREKVFMGRFWTFRKQFGTPEGDDMDSYWQGVLNGLDAMTKEAGGDVYCTALAMVCLLDLESRYRRMYGTPNYDENLAFFNETASHLNTNVLRQIGLKMNFERVV